MKFLERIQISFVSKVGAISDVQAKLSSNFDSLDVAISPMKMKPDGSTPEIIMMIMLKETITNSPSLKVQC